MSAGRKNCFQKIDGKVIEAKAKPAPQRPRLFLTQPPRETVGSFELADRVDRQSSNDSLMPVFTLDNMAHTNREPQSVTAEAEVPLTPIADLQPTIKIGGKENVQFAPDQNQMRKMSRER